MIEIPFKVNLLGRVPAGPAWDATGRAFIQQQPGMAARLER
jgi:hypothetical protein